MQPDADVKGILLQGITESDLEPIKEKSHIFAKSLAVIQQMSIYHNSLEADQHA